METREQRIEAIMKELRPKVGEAVRQMVSSPTEAGCKIVGERLKGSGMRWVEDGAAPVASLRALYVSSGKLWDGFWSQPRRRAA